jgi:hypothetical protein
MKVYDRSLTAAETGHAQDVQKLSNGSGGKSGTRGADAGDRVEFSSTLGRLARTLTSSDNDRAQRVQVLAAQYQSGNYRPDSAITSRAMLNDALAGAQ